MLHGYSAYTHPHTKMGDWKLLVDCFNATTLVPNDATKVELYNIARDPYEYVDQAAAQPAIVKQMVARMAYYAASSDQVPPTLFPPFNKTGQGTYTYRYRCVAAFEIYFN